MDALLPIAHAGHFVAALPFFGPMLMLGGGLLFLMWRDRRGGGATGDDGRRSSA